MDFTNIKGEKILSYTIIPITNTYHKGIVKFQVTKLQNPVFATCLFEYNPTNFESEFSSPFYFNTIANFKKMFSIDDKELKEFILSNSSKYVEKIKPGNEIIEIPGLLFDIINNFYNSKEENKIKKIINLMIRYSQDNLKDELEAFEVKKVNGNIKNKLPLELRIILGKDDVVFKKRNVYSKKSKTREYFNEGSSLYSTGQVCGGLKF